MAPRHPVLAFVPAFAIAVAIGCSEDEPLTPPTPTPDAATGGDGDPGPDGSIDPGVVDASVTADASTADAGQAVAYTIPSAGGTVAVTGSNGHSVSFTFPASAAGLAITLSASSATAIGWPAGTFDEVIQMEPDGTTFDDPIVVTPESGNVFAFSFPNSATQNAPEALQLNADGTGVLLHHFSTLAFVPIAQSCEGTNSWTIGEDPTPCADFPDTQFLSYSCNGASFCYQIDASCCAPLDAEGCSLAFDALQVSFTPTGTNGGEFPYCAVDDAGPAADGAADGSAVTGDPTLLSLEPSSGAVGTTVTVTGENFDSYFGTATNHYVAGFDFEDENGEPVSPGEPTPATQDDDLNIMYFDVPNLALGTYEVRMVFRDGTESANTLPFEITGQ